MITLYSYPQTRGVRVTWALQELGLDYDYKIVNLYKGEHRSTLYADICPAMKVPAINDSDSNGDFTLTESSAIVTYLAEKSGKLIPPANTPERAKFNEMMSFVTNELEQALWTQAKHKFALPEDKRIDKAVALGEWEFKQALKVFSKMLGDKDYVLGSEFSVADVIAGHTLSWAQGFEQDIPFENVKAYATRVLTREALKKARAHEKELKASLE